MTLDHDARPQTRRALLAAAVAAGTGAVAASLAGPATVDAANGDTLKVGGTFTGTTTTLLTNTTTSATNADTLHGVRARSSAAAGAGVLGSNSAVGGTGVRGQGTVGVRGSTSSSAGAGVLGEFTGTEVNGHGVKGTTNSTNGAGVFGTTASTTVAGVRGVGASGGIGAEGQAFGTSATGLKAETNGASSRAVHGINRTPSGVVHGGLFTVASTAGIGVAGMASATSGSTFGVLGVTASPSGYGVFSQGRIGTDSHLELREIAAPSTPAANRVALFVRANANNGRSELCVRFDDGTVKTIATQ